jgi:hypothetical protein
VHKSSEPTVGKIFAPELTTIFSAPDLLAVFTVPMRGIVTSWPRIDDVDALDIIGTRSKPRGVGVAWG